MHALSAIVSCADGSPDDCATKPDVSDMEVRTERPEDADSQAVSS